MNTKTILITGGRSPAALDLARLFHSQGHRVIMAESQKFFLAKSSNAVEISYLISEPNKNPTKLADELIAIAKIEKVDWLIPTCEEIFYISQNKERLEKHMRVLCDTSAILSRLHDKFAFNRWMNELSLPVPSSLLAQNETDLRKILMNLAENKVVLKPAFSRFASSVLIDEPSNLLKQIPAKNYPWVVQQYIPGIEYCTYSVFNQGKLLAHNTYYHAFSAGKGAGICFETIENGSILNYLKKFGEGTKVTGQFAFDFILDASGSAHSIECNPRSTSGIHLLSQNARFADALLLNEAVNPVVATGKSAMLFLGMLVYGPSMLLKKGKFKEFIRILLHAREVVFNWKDPLPFFTQFYCFFLIFLTSIKLKKSMLEATTYDIEYNG